MAGRRAPSLLQALRNAGIGSLDPGRDNGAFGSNAILAGMALLGGGLPIQATQRDSVA